MKCTKPRAGGKVEGDGCTETRETVHFLRPWSDLNSIHLRFDRGSASINGING